MKLFAKSFIYILTSYLEMRRVYFVGFDLWKGRRIGHYCRRRKYWKDVAKKNHFVVNLKGWRHDLLNSLVFLRISLNNYVHFSATPADLVPGPDLPGAVLPHGGRVPRDRREGMAGPGTQVPAAVQPRRHSSARVHAHLSHAIGRSAPGNFTTRNCILWLYA